MSLVENESKIENNNEIKNEPKRIHLSEEEKLLIKKQKQLEANRRYRASHKEAVKKYTEEYRETHKDVVKKRNDNYYSKVQNSRQMIHDLLEFIQQEKITNFLQQENISLPESIKNKIIKS